MYEANARVYLLQLVEYTILADKSHVYIDVRYTWMFSNLDHVSWAWGCGILIMLYSVLGEANVFEMRQLSSYMRLF